MRIPSRLRASLPHVTMLHALHKGNIELARTARHHQTLAFRQGRTCIYLDTKWWIRLREARFSSNPRPDELRILDKLWELVDADVIVCPASGAVIEEVLRQTDMTTRLATASIMDMLSCGIAFTSMQQQAIYEMSAWLARNATGVPHVPAPASSVLTCPAYTIMTPRIALKRAPAQFARVGLLVADALFALMTYSEVMLQWEDWREDPIEGERRADHLNTNISRAQPRAYRLLRAEEALGYWRGYWPVLCQAAGSTEAAPDTYHGVSLVESSATLQEQLLENRLSADLPAAMLVIASGHAGIRLDARRRFKSGDWHDLNHAAMALPYADALFTERSLAHLLSHKPVSLVERHHCRVFWSSGEILAYLTTLSKHTE